MKISNNYEKFCKDYSLIKPIDGGGSYGIIYLVLKDETNKEYIAKVIYEENKKFFKNEKKINEIIKKKLNNPNIVEYIESRENEYVEYEEENRDLIIFEYCSKGELLKYIQLSRGFEEKIAKIIFKIILEIVGKLHEIDIYHLDLKFDNILLDEDFNIKIHDFGLSEQKDEINGGIFNDAKGAEIFRPPQMFTKSNYCKYYGDKADIFSLGANLFPLVTGIYGFQESSENDYYYNLLKTNKEEYWNDLDNYLDAKFNKKVSTEFKELFEKMVSYNEENRGDIKDLLKHKWFDEINNLTDEEKKKIVKEALEEKEIKVDNATKKEVNPKHKDEKKEACNGETTFNDKTEIRYEKNEKIFDKYIKINDGHLLLFNKIKGSLSDYYYILQKLMEYAQDFI